MDFIPRRIIQTGKTADLPLRSLASAASIRSLNPAFEYVFFDDRQVEDFVARQPSLWRRVFHEFKYPIQRFDFFRYLAIYQFGGFYFDLDVFLARSLDPLLASRCVFSFEELTLNRYLWDKHGLAFEIGNYAFGSAPQHPFLRAVIDNCVRAQEEPAWVAPMLRPIPRIFHSEYAVFNTTGPGLLSRTLAENPGLTRDVTVLLPSNPLDRRQWHNFGPYGVHLMEHSWHPNTHPVRKRLFRLWRRSCDRRLATAIAGKGLADRPGVSFIAA